MSLIVAKSVDSSIVTDISDKRQVTSDRWHIVWIWKISPNHLLTRLLLDNPGYTGSVKYRLIPISQSDRRKNWRKDWRNGTEKLTENWRKDWRNGTEMVGISTSTVHYNTVQCSILKASVQCKQCTYPQHGPTGHHHPTLPNPLTTISHLPMA